MRAVRCVDGSAAVVDVAEPSGAGVKVRVASAGICGSDLHFTDQFPLPVTLGHEFAGFLDDGRAVAVEPLDPCWTCQPCIAGDYQLCVRGPAITIGIGVDGGMADACLVPESAIVALPAGLDARDACLVEPLAVALHGVRRGGVQAEQRVAVIGAGTIGLAAVAALNAVGASADLAARHDHQIDAGAVLGARPFDAALNGRDVGWRRSPARSDPNERPAP